ncbi:transcription factor GTE8-like isoform X3 [Cucumis melo var. makuwa]|uniref:Transcription factor GTE8-like isoform X3 n=1 Tax=Cucumis melo var. makuwa TaxID=1194695 RepID=A0A5A7UJ17_CUCMM|nr:transcription factor GTE8-like isoform X3 [Cucumis melo var. makuwa]
MSGKDLPTQSSASGQTSGEVSQDRLSRAALLRNHFADTILKAREKHLKRGSPDAFPDTYLRRRENLRLGNTPYFPREAFFDALHMASGKPRSFPTPYLPFPTHTYGVGKTYALGTPFISHRRENLRLGNTPYFPCEAFPDALLMASGKPRPFPMPYLPFPTHTYGVGKTYALGIPLISHVRLVPMHYLRHREYPLFPDVLCPTHELCVRKTSYS